MSEEHYFVIYNIDGDTGVHFYTKSGLLGALSANQWGSRAPMSPQEFEHSPYDTNEWGDKLLIIKGTVAKVTPPEDWRIE